MRLTNTYKVRPCWILLGSMRGSCHSSSQSAREGACVQSQEHSILRDPSLGERARIKQSKERGLWASCPRRNHNLCTQTVPTQRREEEAISSVSPETLRPQYHRSRIHTARLFGELRTLTHSARRRATSADSYAPTDFSDRHFLEDKQNHRPCAQPARDVITKESEVKMATEKECLGG